MTPDAEAWEYHDDPVNRQPARHGVGRRRGQVVARSVWWRWLDTLAHIVYCPAMLGRRCVRARWYHDIHLMPGSWLGWVCDRYDHQLGMSWEEIRRGR